jgi:hypothetical protein
VGENVIREAMRDPIQYAMDKALILDKENRVLSKMVYKLADQLSEGDKTKFNHLYYAMMLALNVVNTQMEIDNLKEIYS